MIEANQLPAEAPSGASDRVRLALAARDAALRIPGVIATDAGPRGLHVTVAGDERLKGITCTAANDGGYDISVWLITALVSLPDLSRQITAAITRAADRLGVPCSSVSVHFANVVDAVGG